MGAETSHEHRISNNLTSIPLNVDLILHKKYGQMRQTLSFHRKKQENKLTQWKNDEHSIRTGNCSFNVKYLGCIEVKESRGMDVCEQAIEDLLNIKITKHYIKAILHISGDALRVVDERNKGLIVDQTIDKVSYCAPDRKRNNGFAYICRDGTSRRWVCHGFLTIKDSGERLSHAVGCAFQVCLEKKQNRAVTLEYTPKGTLFRRTSITERIIDPQCGIIAEPIPYSPIIDSSPHTERSRPKGKNFDILSRSFSLNPSDFKPIIDSTIKRQYSLTNPISEEIESNPITYHRQYRKRSTNPFDDDIIYR